MNSINSNEKNFNLTKPIITISKSNDLINLNKNVDSDKEIKNEVKKEDKNLNKNDLNEIKPINKQSLLLRLFESSIFNFSMAIIYLYKSKEPGVLTYIGNKMFQFDKNEIDFYLPQLITLYINNNNIVDSVRPYLLMRCKESLKFSLNLIWLLDSFCLDTGKNCHPLIKKKCAGLKLKQEIKQEIWYEEEVKKSSFLNQSVIKKNSKNINLLSELNCSKLFEMQINNLENLDDLSKNKISTNEEIKSNNHYLNVKKSHQRSYSETTNNLVNNLLTSSNLTTSSNLKHPISNQSLNHILNQNRNLINHKIGDLHSGLAFDNNCLCFDNLDAVCNELKGEEKKLSNLCHCDAPKLSPQNEFVNCLLNISKSLKNLTSKELRMQRLIADLQLLNLNLPARVYVPIYDQINHIVLRIPPQASCLLNSKDRAPFLIYIEILKIDGNICSTPMPSKLATNSLRATRSEENLLNYYQQNRFNNCSSNNLNALDFDTKQKNNNVINASDIRKRLTNSIKESKISNQEFKIDSDPSAAVLKEPFELKSLRLRQQSPYGYLKNWALLCAIVKSGDDLRQEMMSYQLLTQLKLIWQSENLPLYLHPYKIMTINSDSGFIEPIVNSISLSQIKKENSSLFQYFIKEFGSVNSEEFMQAQRCFCESLAAYSIVSYLFQLKDRHNQNILIDKAGHIIHIDYGFILSCSPGKNLNFETAPMKITDDYIEILGGLTSDLFSYFKILLLKGMLAARKNSEKLISIVEILQLNTQLPCFNNNLNTIKLFKDRFHMTLTEEQLQAHIDQMVENSIYSITTKLYDSFQYYTNNIL